MKLKAEKIERMYFRSSRNTNYFYAVESLDFDINMLRGLLVPSIGRVFLDETDIYALADKERSRFRNRHFGIIPQGQTGLQSLTVLENVMLPAAMYGNGKEKKERAEMLLDKLGIGELREVYSNELSGGELRRMSVARALINEPEIIIADEPTADLDADTTVLVMDLLKDCAKNGASVLLVTHDKDVLPYADIVLTMEKGVLN